MKRLFDLVVGWALLLLSLPIVLVCAAAVRISSPGPALHRQRRLGLRGSIFELYKFRTMYLGAPDWRNQDGSTFAGEADPRVTPVGRLLRHTSLDELPQLWNVIRGEMSLVGPRPDLADQVRFYTPVEMARLTVKPGITGLAQISGRNRILWQRRKQLDLEYVARQSLLLDLEIVLKTVPYVLLRRDIHTTVS